MLQLFLDINCRLKECLLIESWVVQEWVKFNADLSKNYSLTNCFFKEKITVHTKYRSDFPRKKNLLITNLQVKSMGYNLTLD